MQWIKTNHIFNESFIDAKIVCAGYLTSAELIDSSPVLMALPTNPNLSELQFILKQ